MRSIFKPALILFSVCIVVAGALAFTNSVTKDKIVERAQKDAESARTEVLPDAETFKPVEGLDKIVKENPELDIVKEVYAGFKGDEIKGYVFGVSSSGYGGEIKITVGIDMDGKITAVKIGENKETPGLGSKAAEEPFKSQFKGVKPNGPFKVVKTGKTKPEDIDAISGATITSKAVTRAVQASVDAFSDIVEGGSGK